MAKEAEQKCIQIQCNAIMDCLDSVFGTGSADKILGENTDLQNCFNAFRDLCSIYTGYENSAVGKGTEKQENE